MCCLCVRSLYQAILSVFSFFFSQIAAKLGSGTPAAGAAPAPAPAGAAANGSFTAPNPLTGGLSDKGNPNNMPLGVKRSFPGGGDDDHSAKKSAGEPDGMFVYTLS